MKEIFKFVKSNWKDLAIFLFVFIWLIPTTISMLYKIDSGCVVFQMEWQADTALLFYGNVLTAVIAIYGVFKTIESSRKQYREELRMSVLPFITITTIVEHSSCSSTDSEVIQRQEEIIPYFIFKDGEVKAKQSLTAEQDFKKDFGVGALVKLKIENTGKGVALNLRYGINSANSKEPPLYLPSITVSAGESRTAYLFFEDFRITVEDEFYVISLNYVDIYANKYQQSKRIEILHKRDEDGVRIVTDMNDTQEYLGGVS